MMTTANNGVRAADLDNFRVWAKWLAVDSGGGVLEANDPADLEVAIANDLRGPVRVVQVVVTVPLPAAVLAEVVVPPEPNGVTVKVA